jgi:hypothetical protein
MAVFNCCPLSVGSLIEGDFCMKTWKQYTFTGILVFFVLISAVGCSSNSLSGTWKERQDSEYDLTIKFSGKKFTMTIYPVKGTQGWRGDSLSSFYPVGNRGWREYEEDKFTLIRGNGNSDGDVYRYVMNGTYSISDNKIELLFSDGKINVCSFSRTENTVTIDRTQLTRAR